MGGYAPEYETSIRREIGNVKLTTYQFFSFQKVGGYAPESYAFSFTFSVLGGHAPESGRSPTTFGAKSFLLSRFWVDICRNSRCFILFEDSF